MDQYGAAAQRRALTETGAGVLMLLYWLFIIRVLIKFWRMTLVMFANSVNCLEALAQECDMLWWRLDNRSAIMTWRSVTAWQYSDNAPCLVSPKDTNSIFGLSARQYPHFIFYRLFLCYFFHKGHKIILATRFKRCHIRQWRRASKCVMVCGHVFSFHTFEDMVCLLHLEWDKLWAHP